MSLRVRINLLVTALMLLFIIALSAAIVDAIRLQVREEIAASTKVTVQLLTTVLYSSQFVSGAEDQAEVMRKFLENLGRVRANEVRLLNVLGDLVYTSPPSTYKAGRHAPAWFTALIGPPAAQAVLRFQGGRLVIVPDASRSVLDAWDDLRNLLGVAALFFVAINVLVFWLIGRLLRPVRAILTGLSTMEQGRFDARLPPFTLPELSAISQTFNRMADALERTGAENRRLALVVQQASDAIMIVDQDGAIVFCNSAAERLLGRHADAARGMPVRQLAPPGKEKEIAAHLAATARGEVIDNVETQRLAHDGKVLDVSLSAAPLIDPQSGDVVGQICSLRDITEKKRAEDAARELHWNRQINQLIREHVDKERRALARELHDEFSQCATAIKTIGMTVANRAGGREPEIRAQALTIVSVAGQLYDMAHGMIRKLRAAAPHRLGLVRALEEAVAGWRTQYRDIRFELTLSGALETIPEELAAAVYRIVQESLTNVVRHAGASRVDIEVSREENTAPLLRVIVADDGRGMGAREGGPGFGLLGMRERVEALSGQFRVESRPGEGMRVVADLPLPEVAAGGPRDNYMVS